MPSQHQGLRGRQGQRAGDDGLIEGHRRRSASARSLKAKQLAAGANRAIPYVRNSQYRLTRETPYDVTEFPMSRETGVRSNTWPGSASDSGSSDACVFAAHRVLRGAHVAEPLGFRPGCRRDVGSVVLLCRGNLVHRARYSCSQDLARATCGAGGTVHPSSCDEGADRSRSRSAQTSGTRRHGLVVQRLSFGGAPRWGPRVRFRSSLLYGTSTPSTKSWITPAANPPETTVSVPAVLISSWSFAASA